MVDPQTTKALLTQIRKTLTHDEVGYWLSKTRGYKSAIVALEKLEKRYVKA